MILSAHDVAAELRRRLGEIGLAKLHKLLYYCQGWSIAWTGEPLFRERVEAWTNGPVVADLWHDEKRNREVPPPRPLTGDHAAILAYVLERYGHHTGVDLIRMTHQEDPWKDVSESDDPFSLGNAEITTGALREWFTQDEVYVAHVAEADRARTRRDIYAFAGPAIPDELLGVTIRVLAAGPPGDGDYDFCILGL